MRICLPRLTGATFLILFFLTGRGTQAFSPGSTLLSQRAAKWALGTSTSDVSAVAEETEKTSASISETRSSLALVPVAVTENNIEFASGVVGGLVGLSVGGPILGAVTAALANYSAKTDENGRAGEIARAAARTAVEVYNYLAELDAKFEIAENGRRTLESAVGWVKARENVDAAAVEKVERALADAAGGIRDLNDEYDIAGAGLSLMAAVGDLVEETVKAISGVNKEYQLSDRAMANLKDAVEMTKKKQ